MSRLAVLLSLLSIIVVGGCAAPDAADAPADSESESSELATGRVGVHGMIVFGDRDGTAYLSHIPMFHAPHDVQAVVEVKLTGASLARAPRDLSDRLYTFVPEPLSLDELRLGTLRTLRGTLYLGNFEDGGRPIASSVTANVVRVVHQHVLDASAPRASSNDVIRAGAFSIARIGGAPGIDRIAKVEVTGRELVLSCLVGPDFVRSCAAGTNGGSE
jgi:hypothetical protein